MQEKLSLQTDILTEALHRSRLPIWFSRFPSDIWFGGRAYPLEQSPEGLSLLFNPPAFLCTQGASTARRLIDNLCKVKASEKPTRAVLVLPELPLDGKDMNLADYARSKNFLEILRFPRGTLRFEIPSGFSQEEPDLMSPFQGEVTVFLFLNTKSLLFDPIDWGDFERALLEWNSVHCPQGAIPLSTRQKFQERQQLSSPPREYGAEKKRVNVISLMSSQCLKADPSLLRKQVHNGPLFKLITKVNEGDKAVATIGLLPHALKKIVCDKHPNGVELLDNLSQDIIKACAIRFAQYQKLSARADKFRQDYGKQNVLKCLDPFHFLEPVHRRVLTLRSTCVCDLVGPRKRKKSRTGKGVGKQAKKRKPKEEEKPPQRLEDTSYLDHKHPQPRKTTALQAPKGKQGGSIKTLSQAKIQDFLVPCPGVT